MANFVILLKKNLLEMVRNKRIIIFSVVFGVISVISALSARFLPELFEFLLQGLEEGVGEIFIEKATVADSYVQFISNMGEIAVLLIAIMFAGTITKEKTTGTYQNLKMNKVKDREIILSHFAAQLILITVSYILSVAVFVILNILLFRQIMGVRGFVVLLYVYLILLITTCFALFSSCLCKKSSKSYLLVILVYFGVAFLEVIPRINKVNPFHLITVSTELMYYEAYSLKENLITCISTLLIGIALVVLSLFVVKNKINNRKEIANENNPERV